MFHIDVSSVGLFFSFFICSVLLFYIYPGPVWSYIWICIWAYWICSLISFVIFRKFSAIFLSLSSSSSSSSFPPSGIPIICMSYHLIVSHSSWVLPSAFFCSLFFPFVFQFGSFLLSYLQIHWFFFWLCQLYW